VGPATVAPPNRGNREKQGVGVLGGGGRAGPCPPWTGNRAGETTDPPIENLGAPARAGPGGVAFDHIAVPFVALAGGGAKASCLDFSAARA